MNQLKEIDNFERVKTIITFLDENHQLQPNLEEISAHIGVSTFHLHRIFSDWAGITPKAFLRCLTLEHAKRLLKEDFSVLDATLESGLSGPGRLHDLCVSIEAASPGEIKSGGTGLSIRAGFAVSPFGHCLIAECQRGICHLSFEPIRSKTSGLQELQAQWPNSEIVWDERFAKELVARLFESNIPHKSVLKLKAYVRGSDFQIRVWRALLRLPSGYLTTYGNLASKIGTPQSSRAVGTAVSNNPIAYLIPCHRVIRSTGASGEYRWGAERKKAILAWESCRDVSDKTGTRE